MPALGELQIMKRIAKGTWAHGPLGLVVVALSAVVSSGPATPAQPAPGGDAGKTDYLHASTNDMRWWREARFGLFIHWGPVSLKGTEISWSRGGERRGTGGDKGPIPVEVYDNLYQEFNPAKFNAKEWVAIARAAGMKYLVFTTKHHDGFCEFDSKLTDYKITRSPFGRDVVKELAEACHQAGLKLGFYYSPPDWHHPDYRTENHQRYIEYLHGHLRELCSNYGRVDILWFDGLGGSAKDWDSENLFKMMRQLQPHLLINNRAGLSADWDTPEQEIGKFQNERAWESCITICNQWAWKPGDEMKSLRQCLQTLIRCAGGDGNLLFNVGPMPTGEIEPRQVERLKEMGRWLGQYGESIYATRGGPFKPGDWGASTYAGKKIHLHLFNTGSETLSLPAINKKIVRHSVLTGGQAQVAQTEEGITVTVPQANRQEIDTIVLLELNGLAGEITPRSTASGSLTANKPARASNVFQNQAEFGPDKALDEDSATRWATDGGTHQAWLEVDLGASQTFDRVHIEEAFAGRVQKFELQSEDGGQWQTFLSGTTLGPQFSQRFKPVTARRVRINILEASEGPTLWEFQLFKPGK